MKDVFYNNSLVAKIDDRFPFLEKDVLYSLKFREEQKGVLSQCYFSEKDGLYHIWSDKVDQWKILEYLPEEFDILTENLFTTSHDGVAILESYGAKNENRA